MTKFYTYFSSVPSNWSMKCIVEWLRISQPISLSENNPQQASQEEPKSN